MKTKYEKCNHKGITYCFDCNEKGEEFREVIEVPVPWLVRLLELADDDGKYNFAKLKGFAQSAETILRYNKRSPQ